MRRVAPLHAGGGGADEPGIDRETVPTRGVLDARLEMVGHAQIDPGHRAVVALWISGLRRPGARRGVAFAALRIASAAVGRGRRDHELGVTSTQAELDLSLIHI